MNSEVVQAVKKIRDDIVANYYAMKLNASGDFDKQTKVVGKYPGGVGMRILRRISIKWRTDVDPAQ